MQMTAAIVLMMFIAGSASADIIEWSDADGVKHYTNLKDEIPDEQRDSEKVIVNELARHPPVSEAQAAEKRLDPPPAAAEPRHQAQVIYDRSMDSAAYIEGLVRGLEAARGGGGGGGSVQINGPLAVANAPAAASPAYLPPYYPSLLTTSFDRGRSRFLTLRLLLQDQFAVDREGPFIHERLGPPFDHEPLSVNLHTFLPRGLPHDVPRQTRVITRAR